MREHIPWTIPLGRWGDVHVRLHMFFVVMAAGVLYVSWLAGRSSDDVGLVWLAVLGIAVLAASVALHVAGHAYAAARLGVQMEPLVIGPLGDFADEGRYYDPRAQLIIGLAGPAGNILLALACFPAVFALGDNTFLRVINPLSPPLDLATSSLWLVALQMAFWINWTLALVSLLPAYPLDGARITPALLHWLRPHMSPRHVARIAMRIGLFTGLALIVAAWFARDVGSSQLVPPWFLLLMLAILTIFGSQRQTERPAAPARADNEDVFGYDFSQGYTSLERSHSQFDEVDEGDESGGPLERWLDTRRAARREKQEQLEAEEDRLVDEILARVHDRGMGSLTPEERLLLQRVSQRYRTRTDQ